MTQKNTTERWQGWHHPECTGECLACLIERAVEDSFGTQGIDFLRKKIAAVAKPSQEPVAWINWSALTGEPRLGCQCESELVSEPLFKGAPTAQ